MVNKHGKKKRKNTHKKTSNELKEQITEEMKKVKKRKKVKVRVREEGKIGTNILGFSMKVRFKKRVSNTHN